MSTMEELYEKVAKDPALQAKFADIVKDAEKAGAEATREKLAVFANDLGYEIGVEEMRIFFKGLTGKADGELSDAELDMVAGGKSRGGGIAIAISVVSVGIGCAALSADAIAYEGSCKNIFE